ncbi:MULTISPECIES: methylenetetrahydrofolate reductase [NAD(P)H] [Olleya]|uniref:Methylenetetrahydrofolate reductase n=1 Tax=Olleya namhaensis TaxID=1144750 RepID=A0A1I3L6R1_9FLAO|nr:MULTISPECIES: methylenetetrahydrofolate reductase [NAD(P)H] [Olleya]PKG49890.1 methylenetetrahydrofolate reductase [NAD(P)H] [Olleya sp. 1-3]SFI80473.1 5,10-methylenetetrahydrofolate reductase (NAD(P)) [Olleya namhaensis]
MKVTEHISRGEGKTQFSFEILPPLKGQHIQKIFDNIDPLMAFNPPFIDVTYHREEYVYKDLGDGLLKKQVVKKRPGTVGICAAIQNKYNVDAIPHILCGGFTKEDTENFLIDLDFLNIDNVMALRGDAVKTETYFTPEKEGHAYASDLVKQIAALNKANYLDDQLLNCSATDFCVGVGAYPEKHMEAPSLDSDIHFLKKKIKNGAEYVVTQMFFDNEKYFQFVDKCRSEGITVPIIPGLKPISTLKQLNVIPHRFHVDLPEALIKSIIKCKTNVEVRQVGIEWCIQQSLELKKAGLPMLHYYSMGKSDNIKAIAEAVF